MPKDSTEKIRVSRVHPRSKNGRTARLVTKQLSTRQQRPDQALKTHHQISLDLIDANGYVTDREYATQTPRAKATRSLNFKKLVKLGIIERKGRGTYYQRK